ncbi:hypothetical protein BGZ83_003082 [Gryganskiella cystojenkinii]|nr:hypothetical protein BGZ83_003082 [Gryganskiella cystojenkinii]
MRDMSQSALHGRYRIVVIADPQLTDWFSYKQTGIGLWLTEFYTDLFMRRSFRRLHARFQPDAVLFLGDLLDGGRETMDQPRFERNKWRFYERVFDTTWTGWNLSPVIMDLEEEEEGLGSYDENLEPQHRDWSRENHRKDMVEPDLDRGENKDTGAKTVNKDNHGEIDIGGNYSQRIDIPLDAEERSRIRSGGRSVRLYVAGNHDYGFGDTIIRNAVKRYKRDFGSINYELQIGNHTLVVLDTLALSSNITSIRAESQEFLTHISKGNNFDLSAFVG